MRINGSMTSRMLYKSVRITGTGALAANILQVTGQNIVFSQYAILESVTTLVNATGVYATLYSANDEQDLTADGAVLSGFEVGSYFTKDQLATQTYTVANSSIPRMVEVTDTKKAGRPFTVMQENGVDTFIRFYLTTTDNPVDFTMGVYFEYQPLGGGSSLVFL